ncbi:MAG: AbrB/MazE/SpoVT family DNA-binding domain-containing protein [Candidatus Thiodiazotropha sp. (ex Dulcina madagascariensis)]|nr:AbrB/MazE/SpoVT family DNA-binding domain-containing protein [Candidatus Thiodiazotropha sp. (ex Dulcina madagascariensis)]MCU7936048.1 AbrB/MazE/SpoVT family DNA-binding domain-containing protein [Candidatus Thiodiazotropha sp. (ex Dulcina madagascariensis)]
MHALKLRKIGSSVGVILPKEMLERLNLREGDKLYAGENRNGVQSFMRSTIHWRRCS